MERDIPVYLFTGFLAAGKTKYIAGALGDAEFCGREKVLLIVCEDGELEYDGEYCCSELAVEQPADEAALTAEYLEDLSVRYRPDKVIVEYNGMWMTDSIKQNMPRGWKVYQEFFLADSASFVMYNTNMRKYVYDKLKDCSCVIFNRFTDESLKDSFHKIVRAANVRTYIYYEGPNGVYSMDTIQDPLPFDKNADHIEIKDEFFALWYRDIVLNPFDYDGKIVTFKGLFRRLAGSRDGTILFGRDLMVCCADDIQFASFYCDADEGFVPAPKWYVAEAEVDLSRLKDSREADGSDTWSLIRLSIRFVRECEAPSSPVATFY
jgi:hypothetical protein